MNEMERPKVEGDLPQGFLASDVRENPGPEGHRPEDVVLLQEGEPISPGTLVALMQGREKVLNEHAKPVLHLAGAAGETWQDQLDELRASGLAALASGPLHDRLRTRVRALSAATSTDSHIEHPFYMLFTEGRTPPWKTGRTERTDVPEGLYGSLEFKEPRGMEQRKQSATDVTGGGVISSLEPFIASHLEDLLGEEALSELRGDRGFVYGVLDGTGNLRGVFVTETEIPEEKRQILDPGGGMQQGRHSFILVPHVVAQSVSS